MKMTRNSDPQPECSLTQSDRQKLYVFSLQVFTESLNLSLRSLNVTRATRTSKNEEIQSVKLMQMTQIYNAENLHNTCQG
jgi:hypothetical protein